MQVSTLNGLVACAIALLMVGCHDAARGPIPPASTAAPSPAAPSPAAALTTFRVHGVVTEIVNGQARPVAGVVGEDTYYHSAGVSGVDGAYSIEAVSGPRVIHFNKTGYLMHEQSLDLVQNTRVDVVLVRRE